MTAAARISIIVPPVIDVTPLRLHRLGGDAIDDRLLVPQFSHVADEAGS